MTDVLLVNSSWKYGEVARGVQFFPPIGLNYLAASLKRAGLRTAILDLGAEATRVEDLIDRVKRERIPLVGFSSISPQMHTTMRFIRALKQHFGDAVTIALGGFHISNDPTFLDRHPEVDIGMIGDGDLTFVAQAKEIVGGKTVRGMYRGELIASLDDVPFPDYSLTPMERYKDLGLTSFPLLGTRGCPFNCVFCSRSFMSRKVRFRSPENLFEEVMRNYDVFGGRYVFLDESFTLRRKNVIRFCELLLASGKKFVWNAGALRLDQVDQELMEIMRRSGCQGFFVGVESGSERVRNDIIEKNITDEQIFHAFRIFDKVGFKVELSFVLGNPTETEEELWETVNFPLKVAKMGFRCVTQIGYKIAVPMPGARLWDIAIREGKVPENFIDRYLDYEFGEEFWRVWPKYVPDGLTIERMREIRKKGNMAYYMRPSYVLRRLLEDLRSPSRLLSDFRDFLSMISKGHSTISMTD